MEIVVLHVVGAKKQDTAMIPVLLVVVLAAVLQINEIVMPVHAATLAAQAKSADKKMAAVMLAEKQLM
jgi:hypothetical protein